MHNFVEIYEALRIDGLSHFAAMCHICEAIEEEYAYLDDKDEIEEMVNYWCDYVEEAV